VHLKPTPSLHSQGPASLAARAGPAINERCGKIPQPITKRIIKTMRLNSTTADNSARPVISSFGLRNDENWNTGAFWATFCGSSQLRTFGFSRSFLTK